MENKEIAQILTDITHLLEIKGDNPFRLRAYHNAILAIEESPHSLEAIIGEDGDLTEIPGIGKGVSEKIHEIVETGSCHTLEELLTDYPSGLLDMLQISGMGPKKVKLVFDELGISSIRGLERAAKAGELHDLAGMGVKTEEKLLKAISNYRLIAGGGRFTLPVALTEAEALIDYLREAPGIERVEYAGSLRRAQETIGDLDILATCNEEFKREVMDFFKDYPGAKEVVLSGGTKTTIALKNSMQVDLRVIEPESFGAAMQYFTGSKEHNVRLRERAKKKGLKINEYGVFVERSDDNTPKLVASKTEVEVYRAIGLDFIPPEIRLDHGEIEAAQNGTLPVRLCASHIKGDLHMHTIESDGNSSIGEMVDEAIARGYEYIAITEHSKATGVANGLDDKRLLKHIDRIDKFNESLKKQNIDFQVLKGAEVDIRADGSLDYPIEILKKLDIRVGAVHSGFTQSKDKMTGRVIRALDTGLVDILAHPTGRIINIRAPYDIDIEAVIKAAKETNTAMELNSYPERLDLNDIHLRLAREMGVLVAINTDAHSPEQLSNIDFGIKSARRAWLEPKDILNTRNIKELLALIA